MRSVPSVVEVAEAMWERMLWWVGASEARSWLRALVVLVSVVFVALFLFTAARRMRYPFELEWVESGMLVSVMRVVHHQPLYVAPTVNYVPFLYAPLYFYVCAFVASWTGVSSFTLRLVSTVSAVGALGMLAAFVYRETRDGLASVAAVGLFASLYAFIGAWFDIGRVDSMFVLLFVVALYCTRFAPPAVAAAAWVLAFQTKQSAIAIAIPFLLTYWERRRPSRLAIALGSYAAMAWGSIAFFDHVSAGWYRFYIFGAVKGLPSVMRLAVMYVPEVVLGPMALVVVMIVAAVLFSPPTLRTRKTRFYLIGTVTLVAAFWWVHAHRGVGNSMQVLYAWMALLFGMALARLLRAAESGPVRGLTAVLLLAVVLQLGSQVYNPGQFVPSAVVVKDREGLIEQLRAIPGDVYVVNHSWDAVLAGKESQAEGEALSAVVDASGPIKDRLVGDVRAATMGHRWSAIVVDDEYTDYDKWLTADEVAQYPVQVVASGAQHARFLTSQPWRILLPCSALKDGLAARVAMDGVAPATPACEGR